jgi:hypothetical protein
MEELSATFLTYLPLAPAGLARTIASTNASKLRRRSSFEKLALPMPEWMMPAFSTRNSTWPPLAALTASVTLGRDGAELRVRHQALGAEHLTEAADDAHHVGRRDHAVEVDGAALDGLHQVLGADHVGAGRVRFLGLAAAGEHGDAHVLAGAGGQRDDAADHLVGVARIDAEVQRDLDRLVELGGGVGLGSAIASSTP